LQVVSVNFAFLKAHDTQLVRYASLAERFFTEDPSTCLVKLRQFAETLASLTAANTARYDGQAREFLDVLRRLSADRTIPRDVADLFHTLRKAGNDAVHEGKGTHNDALAALKIARQLGIWYHRTFGGQTSFVPGPFVPPPNPAAATKALQDQLTELKSRLHAQETATEKALREAAEQARLRETAEETATREAEERAAWEQLARDSESKQQETEQRLKALQEQATAKPDADIVLMMETGIRAAQSIDLDEAETRLLIDQQLRDAGWGADSQNLRFSKGVRPAKGKALAIAEWPTKTGPADYALFVGTVCIAVVEAKRSRRKVSAAIDQAERYATGLKADDCDLMAGGPWDSFAVPFTFATNGRPYLKQIETESGIWFRDLRRPTNHRRALNGWPTPQGLLDRLEADQDHAEQYLAEHAITFAFPLRDYQEKAIRAVEQALTGPQRALMVAMATGTGKTKLAIAMLYRLIESKRFRRVCFVVDRSALGDQTADEFSSTKIVSGKSFTEIFGLKRLEDKETEDTTRVHICTIQSLVKRVLFQEDPKDVLPIDQYDLIVVDECHRGYLLDRELSDDDLGFRDESDYVSKYRRVLEHFDAVKIGLTATPALHTVEIFGEPVFTYSYREAVVDGHLIDHEPPIRIVTQLSSQGIHFAKGEQVEMFETKTGTLDLVHLPDELSFEVESFNRQVIAPEFNRVVLAELANHIDPSLDEKTLIFAVNDAHADMIVSQFKQALADVYGQIEDAAVRKITGSVDKVKDLIRAYRNDSFPKIAVTVDLLTTGIDVPRITNLVFLRRVNSRILYEQMIGRATRKCDEIDKEVFRIYDAVDLYASLQDVTAMKPVVVNPKLTLEQLFDEITRASDSSHRESLREQIIVKMARQIKTLSPQAREHFQALTEKTPEETLSQLRAASGDQAASWVKAHPKVAPLLDAKPAGKGHYVPYFSGDDAVIDVSHGYGKGAKPQDFLDGFNTFVRNNLNSMAALKLVVQRPQDLTRQQLRTLRLELDQLGFSETNLRAAWKDATNQEIAASVIGFIRQAALGDPLTPYATRVQSAMERILKSRPWTNPQRQWLKRIGDQVEREIIVDRAALDEEPFRKDGGFARLDKIFQGELVTVLQTINEELWSKAG
jgi:type I restriction enzyme R subunit